MSPMFHAILHLQMISYESPLSDTTQHDCWHHQVPSLVFAVRSFKAHLDLRQAIQKFETSAMQFETKLNP